MVAVISGVVRDPGGNSVTGARIMFASAPVPVPDIAALTDGKGAFTLSAPAPGEYVIDCFSDDFPPMTVSVHVEGSRPVHVEIQLVDSPPRTA